MRILVERIHFDLLAEPLHGLFILLFAQINTPQIVVRELMERIDFRLLLKRVDRQSRLCFAS